MLTHKNNILKCLLLGKNKINESLNQCQKNDKKKSIRMEVRINYSSPHAKRNSGSCITRILPNWGLCTGSFPAQNPLPRNLSLHGSWVTRCQMSLSPYCPTCHLFTEPSWTPTLKGPTCRLSLFTFLVTEVDSFKLVLPLTYWSLALRRW